MTKKSTGDDPEALGGWHEPLHTEQSETDRQTDSPSASTAPNCSTAPCLLLSRLAPFHGSRPKFSPTTQRFPFCFSVLASKSTDPNKSNLKILEWDEVRAPAV